jgi:hypothetical protein
MVDVELRPAEPLFFVRDLGTCNVKTSWLLVDVCGGSSLFDELGCFLRVRHVGHMA